MKWCGDTRIKNRDNLKYRNIMKIFMKEGEAVIMRKQQILCFILLLVICLSGCGGDKEQISSEAVSSEEDTYWTAYRWFSYETEEDTDFSLPTDIWWIDLFLRADGTAQLRDVHDEVYLIDESTMHLTWEVQEDEQIYFYNELYEEPVVSGALEEDSLHLQYRGFELFLRQEKKPSEIVEQFITAELAGTWIMVSGETEGWEWEAMPGHFETLVFSFMWDEYGPGLRADSQYCYYDNTGAM